MKMLGLVTAMLFAGCASTFSSVPETKKDVLAQNQEVSQQEKLCKDQAAQQTKAEVARITSGGDDRAELEIKDAVGRGRDRISSCEAEADRENEKIVRQQIKEYSLQAQQQRERTALMGTLIGSRIH